MNKKYILGSLRLIVAVVVLTAVITQFVYGFGFEGYKPFNFLRFFTIESNVFAAIVFVLSGIATLRDQKDRYVMLRGAAAVYMALTGIVYSLLLTGVEVQTSIPWVNAVLHYVMPVVVLVDWFVDRPRKVITFKKSLVWLFFPLVYLCFSLIAGLVDGWYPYPFLNPEPRGYGFVFVMSALISLAVIGITAILLRATGRSKVR